MYVSQSWYYLSIYFLEKLDYILFGELLIESEDRRSVVRQLIDSSFLMCLQCMNLFVPSNKLVFHGTSGGFLMCHQYMNLFVPSNKLVCHGIAAVAIEVPLMKGREREREREGSTMAAAFDALRECHAALQFEGTTFDSIRGACISCLLKSFSRRDTPKFLLWNP